MVSWLRRRAPRTEQGDGRGDDAAPPAHSSARPPPPRPPPSPPPLAAVGFRSDSRTLLIDRVAMLIIFLSQLLNVLRNRRKAVDDAARLQTLLVLAAAAVGAAITCGAPADVYLRHRLLLYPGLRILLFLSPSMRRVGVGAALQLERPARPGLAGAARNALEIASGTKILMPILQSGGLPPVATIVTHVVLVLLSWTPDYCQTQMMRLPLTRARMGALATALDWLSLPVQAASVVVVPAFGVGDELDADPGSDALCQASLRWASLFLAIILPVLSSIFTYKPPAQQQQQRRQQQALPSQPPGSCTRPRRLQQRLARAVAACDRWLVACLAHRSAPLWRAAVRWWALAYSWQLSKTLAQWN